MSEMVERLAAKIIDGIERLEAAGQIIIPATAAFSAHDIARAVLEAMREPTPDMEAAMRGASAPTGRGLYRMAIDAALKD